ncbi:hypothetical protein EVG20_g10853 [Dentipellis fragilis]|uniref:Uncharacterized protein n=1 Tax=Dentipellis fragilis TaxID=205917 RepID=A0A4Y9XPS4_9AGAM|nr:hypothetical protein EVG20_g10853 [Dentipellis fragilis]
MPRRSMAPASSRATPSAILSPWLPSRAAPSLCPLTAASRCAPATVRDTRAQSQSHACSLLAGAPVAPGPALVPRRPSTPLTAPLHFAPSNGARYTRALAPPHTPSRAQASSCARMPSRVWTASRTALVPLVAPYQRPKTRRTHTLSAPCTPSSSRTWPPSCAVRLSALRRRTIALLSHHAVSLRPSDGGRRVHPLACRRPLTPGHPRARHHSSMLLACHLAAPRCRMRVALSRPTAVVPPSHLAVLLQARRPITMAPIPHHLPHTAAPPPCLVRMATPLVSLTVCTSPPAAPSRTDTHPPPFTHPPPSHARMCMSTHHEGNMGEVASLSVACTTARHPSHIPTPTTIFHAKCVHMPTHRRLSHALSPAAISHPMRSSVACACPPADICCVQAHHCHHHRLSPVCRPLHLSHARPWCLCMTARLRLSRMHAQPLSSPMQLHPCSASQAQVNPAASLARTHAATTSRMHRASCICTHCHCRILSHAHARLLASLVRSTNFCLTCASPLGNMCEHICQYGQYSLEDGREGIRGRGNHSTPSCVVLKLAVA